jgi:hypothetical protein
MTLFENKKYDLTSPKQVATSPSLTPLQQAPQQQSNLHFFFFYLLAASTTVDFFSQ